MANTFTKAFQDFLNTLLPKVNILNNLTTTVEGYALDARQGKNLQDQINELQKVSNSSIDQINTNTIFTSIKQWYVRLSKSANIVTLSFNCNMDMSASSNFETLFILPEGYRPAVPIYESYPVQGTTYQNMVIQIVEDGNVNIYNVNTKVSGFIIRKTFTYVVS